MFKAGSIVKLVFTSSLILALAGMVGCTKKPSQEEISKLEQARSAAESAEKKLAELKQERIQLEQQLEQKKLELKKSEEEREELKTKSGPGPSTVK